jgi:hypothetical protein
MPTLNWIGKKAFENQHRQIPFHLLKEVPDYVARQGSGGHKKENQKTSILSNVMGDDTEGISAGKAQKTNF